MAARIVNICLPLLLLPFLALGQAPPPDVDQALRARVTEFLQYHVDGNFRKAYDMVAEDTKDHYFNVGKVQLQGFKIDDVKFTDNFTRAAVTATMQKTVSVAGQDMPVSLPSTTTWKIENGKWVWYNVFEPTLVTPVGLPSIAQPGGGVAAPRLADIGAGGLPKDFDDKAIVAEARSILQQVNVDKREITLATDKASEDKVVFHNGMTGSVQLQLSSPEIPGFTMKIESVIVRAGADVPVVFRYEPGNPAVRRDPFSVQLTAQPLNQVFVVQVNFTAPGAGVLR